MPRSASPEDRHASSSQHRHRDRDRDRDYERSAGRKERLHSSRDHDGSERRSRRRNSVSSSGEDEEERRRRKRKDRKTRETSDERSARKRKKESRSGIGEEEAERRAKAAETLLYSSEANPFNDSSIGTQFRWGKKAEKEKKMGMTPAEAQRRDEDRRREAKEEIARLNQKRAEREKEQALREEEESRMSRMAESAAMSEWVAKEDDFYLEQSRKRAVIRIRENRAKPIDLLAINLKWVDPTQSSTEAAEKTSDKAGHPIEEVEEDDDEADLEIDLEEPYLLFDDLDLDETEELHGDIQMYLSLEKREHNLDFWRSMIVVCNDRLEELRAEAGEVSQETGIRSRLDPSVKKDMNAMLSKKTYKELVALQDQIRQKLQSGEPVDVEYWEGLLKTILVWRAKAKLSDMHEVIIRNRLEYLRRKQTMEAERRVRLGLPTVEEERAEKEQEAARRKEERERERAQLDEKAVDLYAREAGKDLDADEDLFNLDEDLGNVQSLRNVGSYDWEDKYRPRKPRYFNRVNTGYVWNKYNQSHYDTDNPPPKVVFGYKFNVFYPDLLDKSKSPQYKIVKERGNDETCLILFEAGPPYETIGFRIVNKPWNMSHNRGFKAVFERGVLQLYFQFQRQFYRK